MFNYYLSLLKLSCFPVWNKYICNLWVSFRYQGFQSTINRTVEMILQQNNSFEKAFFERLMFLLKIKWKEKNNSFWRFFSNSLIFLRDFSTVFCQFFREFPIILETGVRAEISIKGIYHGYTWVGRNETTKLSNFNATNSN